MTIHTTVDMCVSIGTEVSDLPTACFPNEVRDRVIYQEESSGE